jgi:hypothetical protein
MLHVRPSSVYADRMLKIADVIAPMRRHNFNMAQWTRHECGSPSCMAGHAVWQEMFGRDIMEMMANDPEEHLASMRLYRRFVDGPSDAVRFAATTYFGIDHDTAHVLFVPGIDNLHHGCIEPLWTQNVSDSHARQGISGRWAANTLRHLVDTGRVDWTRMKEAA